MIEGDFQCSKGTKAEGAFGNDSDPFVRVIVGADKQLPFSEEPVEDE